MHVFDVMARVDPEPPQNSESFFVFLNRVSGDYWDQVRDVIERWVSRFPEKERNDLLSRIRDKKNDGNVRGALWELYLHEMLIGSGYEVQCHPGLPDSSRKPDFLATRGPDSFYVEARKMYGSAGTVAMGKLRAQIYDAIDQLKVVDFYLSVDIRMNGEELLSLAQLRERISIWLAGIDVDAEYATDQTVVRKKLPELLLRERGWLISIHALPKSAKARANVNARAIGVYMEGFRVSDDVTRIEKALKDKGSAYGKLDRAYVVAIATSSWSYGEEDMDIVLYGVTHSSVGLDANGLYRTESGRLSAGYWGAPGSPLHSGVSGILTIHNPEPWNWANLSPTLWENPSPTFRPTILPVWRRANLIAGEANFSEAISGPNEALGVPSRWPVGTPFPRA